MRVFAVVLFAVALAACSGLRLEGDLDFLGLSEVCVPSAPPREVLVAPGLISLADGETLADIDFEVANDGLQYRIGVATAGVNAGDAYDLQPGMTFEFDRPLDLDGPGDWPVAIVVETEGEGRLVIDKVTYTTNKMDYAADTAFELLVQPSCF